MSYNGANRPAPGASSGQGAARLRGNHHGARGLGVSDHGRDAYLEEVARILVERNNQLWRAG
jgi:hypothetical protein